MTINGVQNSMAGSVLFDAWAAAVQNTHHHKKPCGDPLVHAAFAAFESYLQGQEAIHAGMIAGAAYKLGIQGGAQLITNKQLAPLLALNILA
jgi:hypothetical protein